MKTVLPVQQIYPDRYIPVRRQGTPLRQSECQQGGSVVLAAQNEGTTHYTHDVMEEGNIALLVAWWRSLCILHQWSRWQPIKLSMLRLRRTCARCGKVEETVIDTIGDNTKVRT